MKNPSRVPNHLLRTAALGAAGWWLAGCTKGTPDYVQGYIEGEFVYVASPLPGAVRELRVQRGAQVKAGELLFALDDAAEKATRDEAERRLAQARANLEDTKKGKRAPEIESIEAQLHQAKAALALSEKQLVRQQDLYKSGASATRDLDLARTAKAEDEQRVSRLEADLATARLGARTDQVTAAEATVRAQEAALARADWDFTQKKQSAPQAGVVFDTLYREGEWAAAGRPVVALLPPQNVKVRAFVPQTKLAAIRVGDSFRVSIDGVNEPHVAKVSFISPQAEFTPPVIYSKESRSKLVFMIEGTFDAAVAEKLHPGQPVDVHFGK
jgi:HlyD family secretion protein